MQRYTEKMKNVLLSRHVGILKNNVFSNVRVTDKDGSKALPHPHPPTFHSFPYLRRIRFQSLLFFLPGEKKKKRIDAYTTICNHITFFIYAKVIPCALLHLGILKIFSGTSLVAQWLRIRLPMQGTRV